VRSPRSLLLRTPGRRILRWRVQRSGVELKIILGAGPTTAKGWISTQAEQLDLLDATAFATVFGERRAVSFLAEHVWEHLTRAGGTAAASNCYSYLAPGGRLRLAVPDGLSTIPGYLDSVRPGGGGPGAIDHKVLYNVYSLTDLLESQGFVVDPLEYFDDRGRFRTTPTSNDHGLIRRSAAHDPRNTGGALVYTSLIVDAIRPL